MTIASSPLSLSELEDKIAACGSQIAIAKKDPSKKPSDIEPLVQELLGFKKLYAEALKSSEAEMAAVSRTSFNRAALESLLTKRFFYAPSFQIYGGVAGLYDYGPPGSALQNNILSVWRQHFILEEDMLEVECTNLTPDSVLKTSGHVERFADYMVKDSKTGDIFRADHIVKQVLSTRLEEDEAQKKAALTGTKESAKKTKKKDVLVLTKEMREEYEQILDTLDNYQGPDLHALIQRLAIKAPETDNDLTEPRLFNLMFETQIGPTGQFRGFLRPETAQGHFLNFKKLYEFNTEQMPFASASIGKSFRNEISPRQGLLRVREFTMAEIEHFVDPLKKDHPRFEEVKDIVLPLYSAENQLSGKGLLKMTIGEAVSTGVVNNQTLGYFMSRIYLFLLRIGIQPEKLRFRQHMANEMAHYACDCWDAEIQSSYGWIECVGCADRSAFDLTAHSNKTGDRLIAREMLPEPIIKEGLVLELVKSKFGPAFKKNAKFVQGYFDSLQTANGDWDAEKLKALQANFEAGNGKATVTGTDGNPYEVSKDMLDIFVKKEKVSIREYTPNVIEPSFGIGRILYSLLEHSYYVREGDEQRAVFSFPTCVAPVKALIAPISNQKEFLPHIKKIVTGLRAQGVANKVDDSSQSIGRRYARNDELGTPFAITVDFQTAQDGTVTLRERDSTKQIRSTIETVVSLVTELANDRVTWEEVMAKHPAFVAQEL